jgi:uncharacterized membrane protein YgdD (TMEM256/DUF423 family)
MTRVFMTAGGLLAAIAVLMGAYGAHGGSLDEIQTIWIDKASRYQMYHAIALLICGLIPRAGNVPALLVISAGWCFLAGIVLFSGSLYAMAMSDIDAGYITPAGGILFALGWVLTALAGARFGARRNPWE